MSTLIKKSGINIILFLAIASILAACNTFEIELKPAVTDDVQDPVVTEEVITPQPTQEITSVERTTYTNPIYYFSLDYPSSWQHESGDPSSGEKFSGTDGFFTFTAIEGGTIDDITASEANHRLLPYGKNPIIESLLIDGQEARLITPDPDQTMTIDPQAGLIIKYPQPVEIHKNQISYLGIFSDPDHIRAIANTIQFSQLPIQAGPGIVSGKLCFPGGMIPPLTLYIENLVNGELTEIKTDVNQGNYQLDLPAGSYQAYAWTDNFYLGGSYSICGVSTCSDHALKPFEIVSGETTSGIDICDWYGGPGSVPYPPSYIPGSISGSLSYPSEFIPPMRVVAFNQATGGYYWDDTAENQTTYTIASLPPGVYIVVAYYNELAGGYTQSVICGLSVDCTDHSLIPVGVEAGQAINGIDPGDWYAPADAFPDNPVP